MNTMNKYGKALDHYCAFERTTNALKVAVEIFDKHYCDITLNIFHNKSLN